MNRIAISILTFPAASLKCMVLECKVAVAKSPLMAPPFTAKLSENRQPEKRVADDPRRSETAPPSPLSRVLLRFMDTHTTMNTIGQGEKLRRNDKA